MEKNAALKSKYEELKRIISLMESVVVAYSGGVDSSFLLKVAYDVLGEKCLAVTGLSETYAKREQEEALQTVKFIGAPYLLINTEELLNEKFASNPTDRCYFCKSELFGKLTQIAKEKGYKYVLHGANADDANDYRPGLRAGEELGVRSPLQEVGLTKQEIRMLSKELGLPTWDKPALACLSSRFPYGHRITLEKLRQVDEAESFLKDLGFREVRVRHHEQIARIEVPKADFPKITGSLLDLVVEKLKGLGFAYVTLDLQGIRSGSMNEVLNISPRKE